MRLCQSPNFTGCSRRSLPRKHQSRIRLPTFRTMVSPRSKHVTSQCRHVGHKSFSQLHQSIHCGLLQHALGVSATGARATLTQQSFDSNKCIGQRIFADCSCHQVTELFGTLSLPEPLGTSGCSSVGVARAARAAPFLNVVGQQTSENGKEVSTVPVPHFPPQRVQSSFV